MRLLISEYKIKNKNHHYRTYFEGLNQLLNRPNGGKTGNSERIE